MRYRLLIICIACMTIFGGCKKTETPDPPTAYNRLLIGMFKSLDKNQHLAAAEKIAKLKPLDPENVFLNKLEESEISNYYIDQAQTELNQGRLDEAIKIISQAREKYPFNKNLDDSAKQLQMLDVLNSKISSMQNPQSADDLNACIKTVRNIIKTYPAATVLEPILQKKQHLAKTMELKENSRAKFSLLCDIAEMKTLNNPIAETMTAQFQVENNSSTPDTKFSNSFINSIVTK